MKKFVVIAAVLFAVGSSRSSAQSANPALEKELIALEKQSWEAWKNRDGDFFDRFLSDDHVEIHPGGVAGKAGVIASVRTKSCVVKTGSPFIERDGRWLNAAYQHAKAVSPPKNG